MKTLVLVFIGMSSWVKVVSLIERQRILDVGGRWEGTDDGVDKVVTFSRLSFFCLSLFASLYGIMTASTSDVSRTSPWIGLTYMIRPYHVPTAGLSSERCKLVWNAPCACAGTRVLRRDACEGNVAAVFELRKCIIIYLITTITICMTITITSTKFPEFVYDYCHAV